MVNSLLGLMDSSTHSAAFGFHFGRTTFSMFSVLAFFNIKGVRDMTKHLGEYIGGKGALTLVQTVWGLDRPQPLPPSIVVTGPVLPSPGDLRETLTREYPELRTFLKGSPTGVVLVTTGSLAQLYPWQVEAIFHGLKQAKCRVVWGLKEAAQAHLPSSTDPDFYISKWIPQAALLQDSAVRVVITHCGWGGAQLNPPVAWPAPVSPREPRRRAHRYARVCGRVQANRRDPILWRPAGKCKLARRRRCGRVHWQGPGRRHGHEPLQGGRLHGQDRCHRRRQDYGQPRLYQGGRENGEPSSGERHDEPVPLPTTPAVPIQAKSSRASGGAEAAAQQIEWAARFGTCQLHYPLKRTNPLSGLLLAAAGFAALVGYRLVRK